MYRLAGPAKSMDLAVFKLDFLTPGCVAGRVAEALQSETILIADEMKIC